MTTTVTVRVNGDYKVAVTQVGQEMPAHTTFVSGRGSKKPVEEVFHWSDRPGFQIYVGPEEPDVAEAEEPAADA